ncbi:MAG: TonB-dependent receptor, partial [Desulfobacterales bacterium]|nr:TonB-dependent receptor [Desulfobacterales bacterium]
GPHHLGRGLRGGANPFPNGKRRASPRQGVAAGGAGQPHVAALVIQRTGTESFTSEKLTAYEAGYRYQPSERLFCDLTIFYNDYRDLYSPEFSGKPTLAPGPPPRLTATIEIGNRAEAQTRGLELVWNAECGMRN